MIPECEDYEHLIKRYRLCPAIMEWIDNKRRCKNENYT